LGWALRKNPPLQNWDRPRFGYGDIDREVAALDRWLREGKNDQAWSWLRILDPDPYRNAVRDAVRGGDGRKVAEVRSRPEALDQPPEFLAVLGENKTIPVGRRRELLTLAVRRYPGDLGLLMALAGTYPINQKEGSEERVRWLQVAVG